MQFWYKQGHSTTLCTFIYKEVVHHYLYSGSNVYSCLLDAPKAFDRVHYGTRFRVLLTKCVSMCFIRLVLDSYNRQKTHAIWNSVKSRYSNMARELNREGSFHNFFSLYIVPLLDRLRISGFGCHIKGVKYIVLEALILPTVNPHLLPADNQHGFRPGHSTLLQLTTDIATGFNQKKPPHRTVCVAVDLTAAFDTVSHNVLISKISRSTLPEVTCRWLSCYPRGRQAVTSCRGVKSSARIVHTGVPQGSKLSPSLFSFYLADMPKPTYPVKRICYADDISVWASGTRIPELEVKINDYLEKMSEFLKSNSLLISAPKSTVTLFTPETKQAKYHPDIKIAGSQLPLNRSPKVLGVHLDTSLTFNVHCPQAATRVSNRNNVLKPWQALPEDNRRRRY